VAKQNGSVPGTFVSQGELNDLGKMLTTLRDYIVSHEARIELIEGWILEYHKNYTEAPVEEVEANGAEEVTPPRNADDAARDALGVPRADAAELGTWGDESPNNSEEG
jgi:hypothetical protein